MDLATIEGALAIAEAIVNAVIKAAPAIQKGITSELPYIQAIAGMIKGTNATQEEIDSLLASANITSADFQKPLPPDDGTTTT